VNLPRKLNATPSDEKIQTSENLLATRERIDHKKLPNIGITKSEQKRKVSLDFVFNIEVNYPCGRSDWELLGKPHIKYKSIKQVAEFKHFSAADGKRLKIMKLKKPRDAEIEQVTKYADEILKDFPQYSIARYVIYTLGSSQYRAFAVSP